MEEEKEEIMELAHEPIPKYRKIFYITITVGVIYLSIILIRSILMGSTAGGH